MAKVEIVRSLFEEIEKKFKGEADEIFDLMESVAQNPQKGKAVGQVGGIVIKELKFRNFRFYFISDGYILKFMRNDDLTDLLLHFVRMSNKKDQQKVIEE